MDKIRLPLIFLMLLLLIFPNNAKILAFSDVDNHWSAEFVDFLSSKEFINGYDDGSFRPDNNISRAEFYKIINRMANFNKSYAVSFSDVEKTDWFYDEVARGIKAGYITPTTGNLNPNRPISREEAIRIIGYVYKLDKNEKVADKFKDKAKIKSDAKGYIGTLVEEGVVDGFPDGNIYPNKEITRGEISKVLTICIEKLGMPKNIYLVDSEIKFGPRGLYD